MLPLIHLPRKTNGSIACREMTTSDIHKLTHRCECVPSKTHCRPGRQAPIEARQPLPALVREEGVKVDSTATPPEVGVVTPPEPEVDAATPPDVEAITPPVVDATPPRPSVAISPSRAHSSRRLAGSRDEMRGVRMTPYCCPEIPSASRMRMCVCSLLYIAHNCWTEGSLGKYKASRACTCAKIITSGRPNLSLRMFTEML